MGEKGSVAGSDTESFGGDFPIGLEWQLDYRQAMSHQDCSAVLPEVRVRTTEVVPDDDGFAGINFFHQMRIARSAGFANCRLKLDRPTAPSRSRLGSFVAVLIPLLLAAPAAAQPVSYFSTLEKLSAPVAARWEHFGPPYFSTNEKLLNRFYSRFDDVGGVTVGVSFQQNFSILVHARPQLCVIFDFNPGVTEILVPFMGQLLAESPTRSQFLSTLLGATITVDETRQMLAGQATVNAVLTAVLERTPAGNRKANLDRLRELLRDRYLARLPAQATPYIRQQALKWIDILQNQELLTGNFFADAIAPSKLARDPDGQRGMAGWLSSEENYALVREYWMTGRIVGVTGDIGGSSVARLAAYLRELRLQVTVLYISNVGSTVEGHFPETWFRDLYATLGQLPVTPQALTFISQGPWQLTGYVRPLKSAQWVYSVLAPVPVETVIRLHEAPLEVLTQLGPASLLASMERGLESINAPSPYRELMKQIQNHLTAIRSLSGDQFREWSVRQAPGVDTGSAIFKTVWVTLTEAGFLPHP
jgi:hypothetical protein